MKAPIRKAVFPVAGLGTRFLPATKAMPKEMLTLVDKPLIQHAVDEARAAGIEQFIFVTSRGKTAMEDHFDLHPELKRTLEARNKKQALQVLEATYLAPGQLLVTRQSEPLGLGHAVWCARNLVGREPFALLLPDVVVLSRTSCLRQMVDMYNKTGGNLLAMEEVPKEHTNRYGILDLEGDDGQMAKIKGMVEKPEPAKAPSNLSIIGRYILQPEIFDELSAGRVGAGGEIQLTDAMAALLGKQPFYGVRYEGKCYDCGDKVGFIEANIAFGLASPEGQQIRASLEKLLK